MVMPVNQTPSGFEGSPDEHNKYNNIESRDPVFQIL